MTEGRPEQREQIARDLAASRSFSDEAGVKWEVFERAEPDGSRSLIFESAIAFRRVRRYDPDWMSMSDAELRRLSWER